MNTLRLPLLFLQIAREKPCIFLLGYPYGVKCTMSMIFVNRLNILFCLPQFFQQKKSVSTLGLNLKLK